MYIPSIANRFLSSWMALSPWIANPSRNVKTKHFYARIISCIRFPRTISHIIYIYPHKGRTDLAFGEKKQKSILLCCVVDQKHSCTRISTLCGWRFRQGLVLCLKSSLLFGWYKRVYADKCLSSNFSIWSGRFIVLWISSCGMFGCS